MADPQRTSTSTIPPSPIQRETSGCRTSDIAIKLPFGSKLFDLKTMANLKSTLPTSALLQSLWPFSRRCDAASPSERHISTNAGHCGSGLPFAQQLPNIDPVVSLAKLDRNTTGGERPDCRLRTSRISEAVGVPGFGGTKPSAEKPNYADLIGIFDGDRSPGGRASENTQQTQRIGLNAGRRLDGISGGRVQIVANKPVEMHVPAPARGCGCRLEGIGRNRSAHRSCAGPLGVGAAPGRPCHPRSQSWSGRRHEAFQLQSGRTSCVGGTPTISVKSWIMCA
jgi:hypothetical protein